MVNRGGNCGCRHGCDESECLEHFIFRCGKVCNERQFVRSVLEAEGLEFSLETVFNCPKARNGLETMIGIFFESFDTSK